MRTREENNEYIRKYRFNKKLCLAREQETCFYCGEKSETIHHINENHSDNRKENLMPVCHNCHLEITHNCDKPNFYQSPNKYDPFKSNALLKPKNAPNNRVTIPKSVDEYIETCNTNRITNVTLTKPNGYKKIIITEGSFRLIKLIESWGFTELTRNGI